MKLEKIITLANATVRLRFLAMERSLRATGCDLPLWVIPYDDQRFELPPNAHWWETDLRRWLQQQRAHSAMAKCQSLAVANYQYVDSDVVFLKNPAETLAGESGFITSCGHWHNPEHPTTHESLAILKAKSTCWQRSVFNSGQFASDQALYTEEELKKTILDPRYSETCLHLPYYDQPGIVLLANLADVPIRNLTLPPTCMESTWAGDYVGEDYEKYWADASRKPYLIHWAGCAMWQPRPIDSLFTRYLDKTELAAWNKEVAAKARHDTQTRHSLRYRARKIVHLLKAFVEK